MHYVMDTPINNPSTGPASNAGGENQPRKLMYPSPLTHGQLANLTNDIKDWQLINGSLIKLIPSLTGHSILSCPIGCTLFPTPFPRQCFEDVQALQESYNQLYAAIACDEAWLAEALGDLLQHDEFTATLWDIYRRTQQDPWANQQVEMGIFRSDYMLQDDRNPINNELTRNDINPRRPQPKQIEFNTSSCAGGTHGDIISKMHQHMTRRGIYRDLGGSLVNLPARSNLAENTTVHSIVEALVRAYHMYGAAKVKDQPIIGTCILFVVQPRNINICDERPLEYALWNYPSPIPTFRVVFGAEMLAQTRLTENGRLIYQTDPGRLPWEVSVLYMRAGYEPGEHTEYGIACRLQLERSLAIKCPGILSHLSTFKKVQQALTIPGALSRFLSNNEAHAVAATFTNIYPFDRSDSGLKARELALDPATALNHVLKPSLEGGGHNVYAGDIPAYLASIPEQEWSKYILMEMIEPPTGIKNILMTPNGLYGGPVKSELGIFGVCIWKRNETGKCTMLENTVAGWSLKTKAAHVDEMSVIKGYGAFDSPCLVDVETFDRLRAANMNST